MPQTNISAATAPLSPHLRTKCGNGKRQHVVHIDERSLWARRTRELCESIVADLGGIDRLSTAQQQLVRRLAGLCVICEAVEVKLAQGVQPTGEALSEYLGAINVARRVSHSIGLARVPRDVTPGLESYFATTYTASEEG